MDQVSKYRLIGAAIWLGLLVIIVPSWYSQPVNFVPDGLQKVTEKSTLPIVEHAYRLPDHAVQPLTDGQQQQIEETKTAANTKITNQSESKQADLSQPLVEKKTEQQTKTKQLSAADSGKWIVRLISYKDAVQANKLLGEIELQGYPVYIKFFEKSKTYSVRIGPYISKAKAEKDKRKLDKILRTNGELRQLP